MRSTIIQTDKIRNVYQPEDESVARHGGGVIIGHHKEDGRYCLHVSNPVQGMSAFIVLDRAEMVELRDSLNRELAS